MNGFQLRFLRSMQDAGAPCLVIGGFALRALGIDRQTSDLDVVTSTAHAEQTLAGIAAFSPSLGAMLTAHGLSLRDKRVILQSDRAHEGDILTSVGELDFAELYARRFTVPVIGVDVPFADAVDQLAIKRLSLATVEGDLAAGLPERRAEHARAERDKDLNDIALLERFLHGQ